MTHECACQRNDRPDCNTIKLDLDRKIGEKCPGGTLERETIETGCRHRKIGLNNAGVNIQVPLKKSSDMASL